MVLGSSANVSRVGRTLLSVLRSAIRCRVGQDCPTYGVGAFVALLLVLCATRTLIAADRILDHSSLTSAVESIRVEDLKTHVNTLASDALQGREAGTTAGHAASAYLVQELRKQAVAPAGPGGHYLQEFNGAMRNILASVPGRDAKLRDEVVIVCAHYDHIGYGTPRNSRGPIGYIHNGADDNASGTAGLLEVIEAVRSLPQPPRRTLLFAFWDGEEKGLLGSKHWITAPTRPLNQIKLVINADMIGRLRPEGVEVTGTRAARGLRDLVSEANCAKFVVPPLGGIQSISNPPEDGTTNLATQARLDFTWDMRADSDHHPFFAAGIPALMLHTGKHDDYHRPSDDADKINYAGTQQLARLMLMLALRAAEADELPTFRPESRGETKEHQRQIEQPRPSPAPRLGLTWNSQLSEQRIVEVIDVAPQSPAAAAGFHIGDRLERFAGYAVSDVADFRSLVVIADRDVTATVRRPGRSDPLELSVRLNGEPTRLGLTWRTDDAEPNVVILTQVLPHSPAALAGLQPLDRVRTFGDHPATHAHVTQAATSLPLPIQLTFERDGILATTSIRPITSAIVAIKPSDNSPK